MGSVIVAVLPRTAQKITLMQIVGHISAVFNKNVLMTSASRRANMSRSRLSMTTPTKKCIIRTSMTSWIISCSLSRMARRTRRKQKTSARELMSSRMKTRPRVSPLPPPSQLLKINPSPYSSKRAPLVDKIPRLSSNLYSQCQTRPTSRPSSGRNRLQTRANSASHPQRKREVLSERSPRVHALYSPAQRAIRLQWKTIELSETRARKVSRGLMSQLAALTTAAMTRWSDSRSLTKSLRLKSLTSLSYWSGTAHSSW